MKKTVEDYMALPYSIVTVKDSDSDTYFIKVKELPGCISEGESIAEAYDMIEDAMRIWLESAIEKHLEIPLPESMQDDPHKYSIHNIAA